MISNNKVDYMETCQVLEDALLEEVSITENEYNNILNIQQKTLEMISTASDAEDVLAHLCQLAEELLPNSVASIMMLNQKTGLMSVLSAPTIPPVGHEALCNLKPGTGGGSCGNAVFHNEAQYVKDTKSDDRWSDLRQVAYDFNLCSCWSMPVRDAQNEAIGTFALSSFEHRSPAPFHKKLLETASSIVSIVLKNREASRKMKLFSLATQSATEGVMITDSQNNIVEVNKAFENIYNYKESDVVGKNPRLLASGKNDEKFYQEMWQDITSKNSWSGEITNKKSDNSTILQWMSVSTLRDERTQEVENYLAVFTDMTELNNAYSAIEHMAYHDSLTSLYNKLHLEKVHQEKSYASLILLNINNFSYLNTAYGFGFGDKILIAVAKSLKSIAETEFVFRVGSDEFALYYREEINMENKIAFIQDYFYNNSIKIENIVLNLSFTYGASYAKETLIQKSALALKQAKESGKNRSHIFNKNEDSIDEIERELFIKNSVLLHNALGKDCLVPFFQGIFDNKSRAITKFEVLARIKTEDSFMSPYQFLEPARLSGMLPEITKVMIDKSFNVMSKSENKSYSFSINITEDDLAHNYLEEYLNEKSSYYKIEPSRVVLEILEGVSATGKRNHMMQLSALKQKGYSLAIDDFGVEYSNFERILDLEIDYLKIDAKYIKDIDKSQKSLEITKAISYFAKNAKIACIAEFVHSQSVQEVVDSLGIDYSQGFYYSQPQEKPIV
ncbi:MAG: EAL domain-containing protein [Campylobacterota bacterium]|nr:EAL domain-containing protein [Campylobacterota bacterium]